MCIVFFHKDDVLDIHMIYTVQKNSIMGVFNEQNCKVSFNSKFDSSCRYHADIYRIYEKQAMAYLVVVRDLSC
ncbi:hypothetical protein BN1007_50025 [Klebsiella variicola]|nr:hypothetical protein BN1200_1080033 [Klebsiella variicola]CTQ13843.1 hypothetical protein BN1007_50025 [Klebsiella variicola]